MISTKISDKNITKEQYISYCNQLCHKYVEDVENDNIIVCENIKLAIARYKDDLQRNDLDFRQEMVDKVFNFFFYIFISKDKRFTPQGFQAFIITNLFGFYFANTEDRKYQYMFLLMGRKNGKTSLSCALSLYMMMADGQSYPRTLLISSSQKNARDTSYEFLKEMISYSPAIRKRLVARASNKVEFKDRARLGSIQTTVMDMQFIDGYIPTSAIIDEIHTYKDSRKFDTVKNSLGTRPNALLFLISSGGYGTDTFCTQLIDTGRRILRGEMDDDRFFFMLYELDEGDAWHEERNWFKPNPGLGTIIDFKMFKDNYITSRNIQSSLEDFLVKRFNLFLQETTQWLDAYTLNDAMKEFDYTQFKDYPCYVGVDLSATRDLTSITTLWDVEDEIYVKTYFFFVEHERNSLRKGNININKWIDMKYIIKCETDTIDAKLLLQYFENIYNNNTNIQGLYYDPWHFYRMLPETRDMGYYNVPIRPGVQNFDPALRRLEELFYSKKINIYKNECLSWNFRNLVISKDQNGNMKPDKNKSADAIDGVISLLNALVGYIRNSNSPFMEYMKAYDELKEK